MSPILLEEYRLARYQWECDREQATNLWPSEVADWTADHPGPTLKQYMYQQRGTA